MDVSGNPYTGTFTNSEDPDEMPHIMWLSIRVYIPFADKKYNLKKIYIIMFN